MRFLCMYKKVLHVSYNLNFGELLKANPYVLRTKSLPPLTCENEKQGQNNG